MALIDLEYDDVLDDYEPNIAELAFIDFPLIFTLQIFRHYMNSNQLESLDISFNTDIELRCQENQLSSLECNNTQMAHQSNQVSALDLSQKPI